MVKISVIMPVYNDENNLDRSIKSILNQSLNDFEIICVDDGSTDNSLSMLKNFSKKDNRIKVISQKNQGSGHARNAGMFEAKGEYIAFLDSDDYMVDTDALNIMYSKAIEKNMDMVSGGIQFIEKGKIELEHRSFKPSEKIVIKKSEDYGLPWYFYKNIFKRSFLLDNNIKFTDMSRGQDPIFLAEILTKIDTFLEIPNIYYSYFTPTVNKLNTSRKYYDYFLHYYEMFKILMKQPRFKNMLIEYLETLISLENRDIYVDTKNELFKLLDVMDKIKKQFVKYGDEILIKKLHSSFNNLIKKINIKDLKIDIIDYEYLYDIYSESVIVHDESETPKISIIIPVYNVEKYLEDCLISVLNQTLENIEIICVNDGSTDHSLDILKDFAKKDSRIKVYSFNNKGLGSARNRGIKRAHGEYIAFLDSDDWLELDFCEKIYESANKNKVDLVLFNAVEEYDDHKKNRIYFQEGRISNPEDFVFDFKWDSNFVLNTYLIACSKLYKTKFLKENNIEFTHTLFEDIPFHAKTFLNAKKISYNPTIFYHYRKENEDSIMNRQKNDDCYCIIDVMNEVEKTIRGINVYKRFEANFLKLKINQFKEKLELTSDVFKWDFIKKIKNEFIKMNLTEIEMNKLPERLSSFYKMILEVNSYYEYIKFNNNLNNKFNCNEINPHFSLNTSFWQDLSFKDNVTSFNEQLVLDMQSDLLRNNLVMFNAYESIIQKNIFDWDYYRNNNFSEGNALLNYIYLDFNNVKNPTSFFDSDFYCTTYQNVKNSKINPFVYYMLYGRFEGKDNLNKNIFIRSANRRELNRKINNLKGYQLNNDLNLIISLTSFPERMPNIIYTLYSLFDQSIKPNKIILCLTEEEFPNKEEDVPDEVLKFKEFGLTIKWCENLRSFTKLLPTLKEFPESVIVTADDDIYYPKNWLEILWNEHVKYPQDIISHRARRVKLDENKNICPYNSWTIIPDEENASFLNFLTGVGGVLYPPQALDKEAFNKKIFQDICPYADDIWFWIMAIKKNTKIRVPKHCIPYLNYVNALKDLNLINETSLWAFNEIGGNDIQLIKLFEVYPEILRNIKNE